jgi:hypothetical protein
MKELIKKILLHSNLDIKEVDYSISTLFSFFKDQREDYFILLFMDYAEMLNYNKSEDEVQVKNKDLEYLLNVIIEDIRKNYLVKFNLKNLDYNLSTILFLNLEKPTENILTELHKIEENYRVSKKYVLPYKQDDLKTIKEKLNNSENIIYDLNKISIENNELINSADQAWYRLLMNLFIKVPFLNFQPLKENEQLKDISDEINKDLDSYQKDILQKLIKYEESQDIEYFLIQNNFFIKSKNE